MMAACPQGINIIRVIIIAQGILYPLLTTSNKPIEIIAHPIEIHRPHLTGKNIALIFEKTSTRTRCAFEVAAKDQGAHVTYLGPTGSQIGIKESMKDTARVLGRMFDGIEYRGFGQDIVEELAKYAGVPVWNGLTNEYHPTQILADFPPHRAAREAFLHPQNLFSDEACAPC